MNRRTSIGVLLGLVGLALGGCDQATTGPGGVTRDGDTVSGTGQVRLYAIEGGFYAIRGDDGVTYDPVNLPQGFRRDSLPVTFTARLRNDLGSYHMVGPMVEVTAISRR